jgi:4-hydroxyphenylpyruvate dioxygenase-like putative hemolysin
MPQSFDFVAFIDDFHGTAAALATTFGFIEQSNEHGIRRFCAGDATWLIHGARNTAERVLLEKRGASPYCIGLKTQDKAIAHPYSFLGLPAAKNPDCLALDPHLIFLLTPPDWQKNQNKHSDLCYKAIDHFAIACPKVSVNHYVNTLIETYQLHITYQLDVKDGSSGMQSVALGNSTGDIRLPIIGPDGDTSQVQIFLDQAKGPGIQHIGLATDNIIETVRSLKNRGVSFLSIKPEYYDSEDFLSMPLSEQDKKACQELHILADKTEDNHYLLQIFTQPCLGGMMIEIIERHHHETFGAQNIKSLFDTVADYQKQHAPILDFLNSDAPVL